MKQLLIVNSAKAVKSGVADDLTVLDKGQIGFFNLTPDASGASAGHTTFLAAKPTDNFGIALGKGSDILPFVIPEVDVNSLTVSVAAPSAGNVYTTKFTFPTPVVGKEYSVVIIKKGVVTNERNTWNTGIVAKTTTAATEAKRFVDAINAKTNDLFPVTASLAGAVVTISGKNIGEDWNAKLVDELSGVDFTSNFPVAAKPNIGDTAFVKDLARRCAGDKGFTNLDDESTYVYPGYPEEVEDIAQADIATKGYTIFTLRFATKRMVGTTDEPVTQYVHIAVPTDNASIDTIKAILGQPVLVNVENNG